MRLKQLQKLVARHGLMVLGSHASDEGVRVLVGNAGSDFWGRFTASAEYSDGAGNPLDRWSRRIGLEVPGQLGARVVFPFDGPPYPPFLEWASQTGQVAPSPITIHIHKEQGLWHAYRFALVIDSDIVDTCSATHTVSPCEGCSQKPCLTACPVNAFDGGTYDVHTCMDYLRSNQDSDCRHLGCAARRACPVNEHNQYLPDHAQFHMNAFIGQDL